MGSQIHPAANLKRAHRMMILMFDINLRANQFTQARVGVQRRHVQMTVHVLARFLDILKCTTRHIAFQTKNGNQTPATFRDPRALLARPRLILPLPARLIHSAAHDALLGSADTHLTLTSA